MKKILLVLETIPKAVKMAPLVKEYHKYLNVFDIKIMCYKATSRNVRSSFGDF